MKDFYKQILEDVAVELTDEFDRNFARKAFFTKRWRRAKMINRRGSLMLRTAQLRRSIQSRVHSNSITWTSSVPYAEIHNEGGEITVTAKMKKYFWAMYMREGKTGIEAEQYKAMALKPVGSKMKIEERRFIGDHPEVRKAIERCADITFREIEEFLRNELRQR
jgi:phage gpG-like protein